MKLIKILTTLIILITITACFETRDKRKKASSLHIDLSTQGESYSPATDTDGDSDDDSDDDTSTTPQTPSHIAHCQWSQDGSTGFEFTSNHIGAYTLCKSTRGETELYFQLKTNPGYNVCFIPVNETNGNMIYIGEPRCLLPSNSMVVYRIDMLKNRPSTGYTSYSSLPLTGVMVMQDRIYDFPSPYSPYYNIYNNPLKAPDAYMLCANWFQAGYPQYCQAFNQAGHYVYHKFNN